MKIDHETDIAAIANELAIEETREIEEAEAYFNRVPPPPCVWAILGVGFGSLRRSRDRNRQYVAEACAPWFVVPQ